MQSYECRMHCCWKFWSHHVDVTNSNSVFGLTILQPVALSIMKLASNLFSQSQYDSNNDSSIVNEKESVATPQIDSQMESKQTTQTNCEEINDMFMTSKTLIAIDEEPTKEYTFRNLNFTNAIDFNYEVFIETKSILFSAIHSCKY